MNYNLLKETIIYNINNSLSLNESALEDLSIKCPGHPDAIINGDCATIKTSAILNYQLLRVWYEYGIYYIELLDNHNYTFTYGRIAALESNYGYNIKFISEPNANNINIEFRSGCDMLKPDWPSMTSMYNKMISYFKNVKINEMEINRAEMYSTCFEELQDEFYINKLIFSECKVRDFNEDIFAKDFKNPNIILDSDKATLRKHFK